MTETEQIEEQAEPEFAEAWKPEKDDKKKIEGTVVNVNMGPDFGYGPYPIVTIVDDADGRERAIHARGYVLRTELARRTPRRGDRIGAEYKGKRAPKSGNGNPFHVYKVWGGTEPEFDWSQELPSGERQARQVAPSDIPVDMEDFAPAPGLTAKELTALQKMRDQEALDQAAAEKFGEAPPF